MTKEGEDKEPLNIIGTKVGVSTLESDFVENNSVNMCILHVTKFTLPPTVPILETFMHIIRETYTKYFHNFFF